MGRFLGRRSVWVPALAVWLAFGIGLTAWVANFTLDRYGQAAANRVAHMTGTSAPADMPSDFPIYPGGQVVQAFTSAAGSEGVIIETPDSQAKVWSYYNSALKQYPWRVNLSVSFPIHEISCLHQANPQLSCSLIVEPSADGTTQVTFSWVPVKVTRR
jgi:hypothetical protein